MRPEGGVLATSASNHTASGTAVDVADSGLGDYICRLVQHSLLVKPKTVVGYWHTFLPCLVLRIGAFGVSTAMFLFYIHIYYIHIQQIIACDTRVSFFRMPCMLTAQFMLKEKYFERERG